MELLNIMLLHTGRTMDGPWIKTVPVVSHIFDVSSSQGSESRAVGPVGKMNKETIALEWNLKICTNWEFCGLNNKLSTSCHYPLLLATGSYALALGRDAKPGHHALVRPRLKKGKSNFFTNHNILHTLKNEPLIIMLLHTSRKMDGPWIKMVPVVSHIFDVSSSTGLGTEGYRTCWKDE